jgi:diguanylate cyclase (GGDEF)-like protein
MLREAFRERALKLRSPVKAALGGLVVGYFMRDSKSRLQLTQAEAAKQAAKAENEHLRHEIAHDDLTGLLTKKALIKKGNERLAQARPDQIFALVLFDLDNFKAINDKHPGKYDEGDRTLVRTAGVLLSNIRIRGESADIMAHGQRQDGDGEAARLGGDEFAGLFEITARNATGEAMSDEERLAALSGRIRTDFNAAFANRPDLEAIGGVDLSIGALIRQPGETMESMLSHGAVLMGEEKKEHHAQNGAYRF